jgi:hypothetical protein
VDFERACANGMVKSKAEPEKEERIFAIDCDTEEIFLLAFAPKVW